MNKMNNKSPHILNTSSTLLGLCFIVLTSLKVSNKSEATVIDELTAFTSLLFLTSSIFSFLSMRSKTNRSERYESAADLIFLGGLILMFIITLLLIFNVIS